MGRKVSVALEPPDPSQQVLVGQHPAGIDRRLGQGPVFDVGQLHRTTGQAHPALGILVGQVAQDVGR
ncbi:MAG: hypothetical protein OXG65_16950 [Chloroflexi bacterium]|nr:hypothetical protein [Chloroflexota bacterium]